MPATKKNKRKIHVNGRDFYWTGFDDRAKYVTIMTPRKDFFANYQIINSYDFETRNRKIIGEIVIEKANIFELSHVQNRTKISILDWNDDMYHYYWTPSHIRRVIVYIFETLM